MFPSLYQGLHDARFGRNKTTENESVKDKLTHLLALWRQKKVKCERVCTSYLTVIPLFLGVVYLFLPVSSISSYLGMLRGCTDIRVGVLEKREIRSLRH